MAKINAWDVPAVQLGTRWYVEWEAFVGKLDRQAKRRLAVAFLLAFVLFIPSAFAEVRTGLLTYYTRQSCQQEGAGGVWTASGARYDESAYTIALPHRLFGGRYRICRESWCVEAVHTDYGPGTRARARGVIADATPALYDALGGKRGANRRGIAWGEISVTLEQLP